VFGLSGAVFLVFNLRGLVLAQLLTCACAAAGAGSMVHAPCCFSVPYGFVVARQGSNAAVPFQCAAAR